MSNLWDWCQGLGVAIVSLMTFFANSAIAQITPDGTLPENSRIIPQGNVTIIEGGTLSQDGHNLFHSFKEFSLIKDSTADFQYFGNVQNIISRVTSKSISSIDGILKVNGTANLFLINPNGIIFGPNASLQIRGSFVASTASSLNFADGTKFSASDTQTAPLLTVSLPTGLQFGATAAPIRNQSQAKNPDGNGKTTNIFERPVGLQVEPGKTLALIGGEITLDGGNLTAASGRIELGSVANNSLVSLEPISQGWSLGYEDVQNFQNIRLIPRTDGSGIPSQVDASGESGGSIQVQAKSVELRGHRIRLISQTTGDRGGKDITISTDKLIVQDGAQLGTSTRGKGVGGNLIVNASESVELIGGYSIPNNFVSSGLFSETFATANAGDITINTKRLSIQAGAQLSVASTGERLPPQYNELQPATGNAGDLTITASEVELVGMSPTKFPSSLWARTQGSGNAGKVTIDTGKLIIRDGAAINLSSEIPKNVTNPGDASKLGSAGELNITAHSILLDEGTLTSTSKSSQGGDILLQVRDLLLMRRKSQISTNAEGDKTGGNISIKAPNGFLVATPFGNNDITANGFSGPGGKITITAKNLFGFVPRTGADVERLDPTGETNPKNLETSDITAFSQQNPSLNGTVQINSPDADPSKGLVELPVNLVDASQQIAASCSSGGKIARNSFITTGRGGLVADPTEPLIADDAVLADWIALSPESQNGAGGIQKRAVVQAQRNTEEKSQKVNPVNEPTQIVEAQGWVIDANGNVVLVAQVPTESPHNSSLTATSCAAH
ncbi:filamentous hemagglutinin [Nostoc sp. 'Peltigera membranacea cyanobiont' 210A]|uniref:filamentous hemagglutinin N-terminal domain-containing protein n=1 Tax=Nostoc sp. 'Peltigera membranacea cyanobiont' 210A TaxID=2014529 RepID=UPI000B95111A|nr:filamentous hemagglutinin N-terminal domain-containing protein [Nostoc sp. 'Peltigera membranacea cyanobiont' 210A]OYD94656.1 filamentous hemagglutinin [Nostoc sp. 'Peltigera membranacea cyanobiont' 210A]